MLSSGRERSNSRSKNPARSRTGGDSLLVSFLFLWIRYVDRCGVRVAGKKPATGDGEPKFLVRRCLRSGIYTPEYMAQH